MSLCILYPSWLRKVLKAFVDCTGGWDPYILIYDGRILAAAELLNVLQKVNSENKSLKRKLSEEQDAYSGLLNSIKKKK